MIILYGFVSEILGYTPDKNKKSAESDAGRRLLDLLLVESGVDATSDNIKIGINGKPYFEGMPGLDFNITHSKGLVACILSMDEGRVGIDTELTEIAYPPEKQKMLAARFLGDDEQKSLADGDMTFSELWTRREAYLKMTGDGFAKGICEKIPSNVRFSSFEVEGYTVTVCTENDVPIILRKYKI